jgi:hypothetical protein
MDVYMTKRDSYVYAVFHAYDMPDGAYITNKYE